MPGELREPTINLAIGPSCPVRCEGCYNHFGNTQKLGGLIMAADLLDFATDAREIGVRQTTLSGGDPLFHPEIVKIVSGLKDLGFNVKVDTVGTSLIEDARIVYKGSGTATKVEASDLAPHVDFVSIPLDGASQNSINEFRRGRPELLAETRIVASLLQTAGVRFGINTVLNRANIEEVASMGDIVEELGADEWQIFEYDPTGPNISSRKDWLTLQPGEFTASTAGIAIKPHIRVSPKSLQQRKGNYFLVDDAGLAWQPAGDGIRRIFGHIISDRGQVLTALQSHIQS